jgi:peptidoglycan/xylan/chitin deacetylase (PgdA/CDA1 family)
VPLRDDLHRLFTRPAALRRHVRRLRAYGYRFVTVGELARRVAAGEGPGHVALSFDDGFADSLGQLLPALGVTGTVFPVTGWLGDLHPHAPRARIVSPAELRTLHAAGLEVGGHTVTHPDLTTLPLGQARSELEGSRHQLEDILDAPVEVAAYPWGAATAETEAACAAAGYRAAVRISGLGSWEDPYALPRQNMLNGCTMVGLRLKRDGRYEGFIQRPLARRVRRMLLRVQGRRRVP